MAINKLYLIFLFLISCKAFTNERYVCKHINENTNQLITNFYVINDKVIMSGATGSGEYKILNRYHGGLLAVNSSFIGKDFGLETVLLSNEKKQFIYKLLIRSNLKENISEVRGNCDFYN